MKPHTLAGCFVLYVVAAACGPAMHDASLLEDSYDDLVGRWHEIDFSEAVAKQRPFQNGGYSQLRAEADDSIPGTIFLHTGSVGPCGTQAPLFTGLVGGPKYRAPDCAAPNTYVGHSEQIHVMPQSLVQKIAALGPTKSYKVIAAIDYAIAPWATTDGVFHTMFDAGITCSYANHIQSTTQSYLALTSSADIGASAHLETPVFRLGQCTAITVYANFSGRVLDVKSVRWGLFEVD